MRTSSKGGSQPWQPNAPSRALAVAGLSLILFVQLALSIRQQSQTFDEGVHLAGGYRYWQCGDFAMNPEHPPFVKLVAAAPMFFSRLPAPKGNCGHEPSTKGYTYALGSNYIAAHN